MSLFGVIKNAINGTESWEDVGSKIKDLVSHLFTDELVPVLDTFLHQFTTDFGKAALAEAGTFAQAVASGGSIVDAGGGLVQHLASQGLTIAEQDATQVAMNAIRIHLSSVQPITE